MQPFCFSYDFYIQNLDGLASDSSFPQDIVVPCWLSVSNGLSGGSKMAFTHTSIVFAVLTGRLSRLELVTRVPSHRLSSRGLLINLNFSTGESQLPEIRIQDTWSKNLPFSYVLGSTTAQHHLCCLLMVRADTGLPGSKGRNINPSSQ